MNAILQDRERTSVNGRVARKRKFRPKPNPADPLAEPTWNRRIWAAILAKYGSLKAFEDPSGISYTTYFAWTKGGVEPELENLERACKLVGYTVDQIRHGKIALVESDADRELSIAEQRDLLSELRATPTVRSAVTEYLETRGKHQAQTRANIERFVRDYAAEIASGKPHADAMAAAHERAINEQAEATAKKHGLRRIRRNDDA